MHLNFSVCSTFNKFIFALFPIFGKNVFIPITFLIELFCDPKMLWNNAVEFHFIFQNCLKSNGIQSKARHQSNFRRIIMFCVRKSIKLYFYLVILDRGFLYFHYMMKEFNISRFQDYNFIICSLDISRKISIFIRGHFEPEIVSGVIASNNPLSLTYTTFSFIWNRNYTNRKI